MNALTVWNLIVTKQLSASNRLWKDALIVFAIVTTLIAFSHFVDPSESDQNYGGFVFALIIFSVFAIGGHAFKEFKQEKVAIQWLTLPASTEEKWVANFLATFFLLPIGFLAVLTLSTFAANVVLFLFNWGGVSAPVFNPISNEGWAALKGYWIAHPLLFFGAIYFKKRPMLKTFGSVAALMLLLVIYIGTISNWLLHDAFVYLEGLDLETQNEEEILAVMKEYIGMHSATAIERYFSVLKTLSNVLFWLYFPFFWALSYLRLRELEL